ncbi:hypothetical protein Q3G72_010221 [Acer saccharum]|nr:hypothetical protein Q3G72_010221 [Acer saccharum]
MGNSLGGKKSTKVMKISGETFKLKTPVKAEEVVKDYPGHVLLESESVKHFGIRAKPLQPHQQLEPKRLYFLVDLPENVSKEKVPRRVRSGINMSAKDRLESLMLSRRSISDLSIMKPISSLPEGTPLPPREEAMRRVRMMLPKSKVDKLMKESKNEAEVAEKIVDLCLANTTNNNIGSREVLDKKKTKNGVLLEQQQQQQQQQMHWKASNGRNIRQGFKAREVSFLFIRQ